MMLILVLHVVALASAHDEHHYASIESLEKILKADLRLVERFQNYLKFNNKTHIDNILGKYINISKDFTELHETREEIFYHPINGFHFLKHVVHDYKDAARAIQHDTVFYTEAALRELREIREPIGFPNSEDVLVSAGSISRMKHFYQLPMEELLKGRIQYNEKGKVFQSIFPLDAWDCNEIGKGAMILELYDQALRWFKAARKKHEDGDKSIELRKVVAYEREAVTKLGKWVSPTTYSKKLYTYREFAQKADDPSFRYDLLENTTRLIEPVAKLCRGEKIKLKRRKTYLSCQYVTMDHACFIIGPLKMEEFSRRPAIIMFHNFLTEKEMKHLIEIATPQLRPSRPIKLKREMADEQTLRFSSKPRDHWLYPPCTHPKDGKKGAEGHPLIEKFVYEAPQHKHIVRKGVTEDLDIVHMDEVKESLKKTAKDHFLYATHHPEIEGRITNRIAAATGLQLQRKFSSEPFQVVSYGIAGANMPHMDPFFGTSNISSVLRFAGDRIATFMVYLGKVTLGGDTVFPLIGVSVPPERGAAVFWYNTFKNGEGDLLTMHAGCPVLYGSKWVTNRWIRSYSQMFKVPCGFRPLERHYFFH